MESLEYKMRTTNYTHTLIYTHTHTTHTHSHNKPTLHTHTHARAQHLGQPPVQQRDPRSEPGGRAGTAHTRGHAAAGSPAAVAGVVVASGRHWKGAGSAWSKHTRASKSGTGPSARHGHRPPPRAAAGHATVAPVPDRGWSDSIIIIVRIRFTL